MFQPGILAGCHILNSLGFAVGLKLLRNASSSSKKRILKISVTSDVTHIPSGIWVNSNITDSGTQFYSMTCTKWQKQHHFRKEQNFEDYFVYLLLTGREIWPPKQVYKKIEETEARKINHCWNKILKVSCSWTPQERSHFSFLLYFECCRELWAMKCFLGDGFCWRCSLSSAAEKFLFTKCAHQFSCGGCLSNSLNRL